MFHLTYCCSAINYKGCFFVGDPPTLDQLMYNLKHQISWKLPSFLRFPMDILEVWGEVFSRPPKLSNILLWSLASGMFSSSNYCSVQARHLAPRLFAMLGWHGKSQRLLIPSDLRLMRSQSLLYAIFISTVLVHYDFHQSHKDDCDRKNNTQSLWGWAHELKPLQISMNS